MTKLEMFDRIQLALRELADVKIQLDRIESCPIGPRKPGEYSGEGISFAFGRVQGMASHADSYLKFAVENLIQCLPDELQAISIEPLSAARSNSSADPLPDQPTKEKPSEETPCQS